MSASAACGWRPPTAGWRPRSSAAKNGWLVRDGVLVNAAPGNDLVTERTFTDFRLHADFRYPRGSNSGIYLRGRYEVQIEDDYGQEPDAHTIGAVYGFLTPSVNAARKAGEWQTLDITLVGRVVTVGAPLDVAVADHFIASYLSLLGGPSTQVPSSPALHRIPPPSTTQDSQHTPNFAPTWPGAPSDRGHFSVGFLPGYHLGAFSVRRRPQRRGAPNMAGGVASAGAPVLSSPQHPRQ